MRRSPLPLIALAASLLPVGWFAYFAVVYRCDLAHYTRLWRDGARPAWATLWVILVTAGCCVIALLVLPKAVRMVRGGAPPTRGEWLALAVIVPLAGLAAAAAPASMVDQATRFAALVGVHVDQCRH